MARIQQRLLASEMGNGHRGQWLPVGGLEQSVVAEKVSPSSFLRLLLIFRAPSPLDSRINLAVVPSLQQLQLAHLRLRGSLFPSSLLFSFSL